MPLASVYRHAQAIILDYRVMSPDTASEVSTMCEMTEEEPSPFTMEHCFSMNTEIMETKMKSNISGSLRLAEL